MSEHPETPETTRNPATPEADGANGTAGATGTAGAAEVTGAAEAPAAGGESSAAHTGVGRAAAEALDAARSREAERSLEEAAERAAAQARRAHTRSRRFAEGQGPAPDPAGSHYERRIRSFQPRRSRVTQGQEDALRRLWPVWGFDIDGHGELDLEAMFEGRPVVLEIGFGMGEATARMAAADPDTGILAVDVHTPGQGNLLALAERDELTNVRVANGDAIILVREMLPPACLDGLRVYFPDPWPKKRHHKRRLIQPEFLDLVAPVLRPGALVHCATDWEPYAEQMLEVLTAHPSYANTQPDGGFAPRPGFRPRTRFESQGLNKGHRVHDLLFRRVRDTEETPDGTGANA